MLVHAICLRGKCAVSNVDRSSGVTPAVVYLSITSRAERFEFAPRFRPLVESGGTAQITRTNLACSRFNLHSSGVIWPALIAGWKSSHSFRACDRQGQSRRSERGRFELIWNKITIWLISLFEVNVLGKTATCQVCLNVSVNASNEALPYCDQH